MHMVYSGSILVQSNLTLPLTGFQLEFISRSYLQL